MRKPKKHKDKNVPVTNEFTTEIWLKEIQRPVSKEMVDMAVRMLDAMNPCKK
jgi:hypothetical protein